MRKIGLTNNVRFTIQHLKEIGITNYLPFIIKHKSFQAFQAQFSIDASTIEVEDNAGNWIKLSDRGVEYIKYSVNIASPVSSLVPIQREGFDDDVRAIVHGVTFRNNITAMENLRGNVGIVVFSTVAKILSTFADIYKDKFQCFVFTPAHVKLAPIYEILSKESEKYGLIYANKETGRRRAKWYLMNKKLWDTYLTIKGKRQ